VAKAMGYQAFLEDQKKKKEEAAKGQVRFREASTASRIQYTNPTYTGNSKNANYKWETQALKDVKMPKHSSRTYNSKFDYLTKQMGLTPGQADDFRTYMDFGEDQSKPTYEKKIFDTDKNGNNLKTSHAEGSSLNTKSSIIDGILNGMTSRAVQGVKDSNKANAKKEQQVQAQKQTKSQQPSKHSGGNAFLNTVDSINSGLTSAYDHTLGPVQDLVNRFLTNANDQVALGQFKKNVNSKNAPKFVQDAVKAPTNTAQKVADVSGQLAGAAVPLGLAYKPAGLAAKALTASKYGQAAIRGGLASGIYSGATQGLDEAIHPNDANLKQRLANVGINTALGAALDPALLGVGAGVSNLMARNAKVAGELPTYSGNVSDNVLNSLVPNQPKSVTGSQALYDQLLGVNKPQPTKAIGDVNIGEIPKATVPNVLDDLLNFAQSGQGPTARGAVPKIPNPARYAKENVSNQADTILNRVDAINKKPQGYYEQRILDVQKAMQSNHGLTADQQKSLEEAQKAIEQYKVYEDAHVQKELAPHVAKAQQAADAQAQWEHVVKNAKQQIDQIQGTHGKIYVPKGEREDYQIPKRFLASSNDKVANDIHSFADQEGFKSADEAAAYLRQLDEDAKLRLKDLMPGSSKEQPMNVSSLSPEDIAKAYNDKQWFHGTGTSNLSKENLDPLAGDHQGLFGHGVYMTDNPEIANGYANSRGKRTSTPTIYDAKVNMNRVLDLEKPIPDDAKQAVDKFTTPLDYSYNREFGEENHFSNIANEMAKKGATTEEIIQKMRQEVKDFSHEAGIPTSEFVENFQDLAINLKEHGYDGITHTGGGRTGHDPHRVLIALDPNDLYAQTGRTNQITDFNPNNPNELLQRHQNMNSNTLSEQDWKALEDAARKNFSGTPEGQTLDKFIADLVHAGQSDGKNFNELYAANKGPNDPQSFDELVKLAQMQSAPTDLKTSLRQDPRIKQALDQLDALGGKKPDTLPGIPQAQPDTSSIDEMIKFLSQNENVNKSQDVSKVIDQLISPKSQSKKLTMDELNQLVRGEKPPKSEPNVTSGDKKGLLGVNLQQFNNDIPSIIKDSKPIESVSATDAIKNPVKKVINKFYEGYVNKTHSAKVAHTSILENEIKKLTESGAKPKKLEQLKGQLKFVKKYGSDVEKAIQNESAAGMRAKTFLDGHMENLQSALGSTKPEDMANAIRYQVAKNIKWIWDKVNPDYEIGGGWTKGEINTILNEGVGNQKLENFTKAMKNLTQQRLDFALKYNLINKEAHAALSKNPYYIPMARDVTPGMDNVARGLKGGNTTNKRTAGAYFIQSLGDGDAEALYKDPLETLMSGTFSLFKNMAKSDSEQQLLKMAKMDSDNLFSKGSEQEGI
jgi:hypothetical protein